MAASADLSGCAAEQAEELVALQAIFEGDCEVECEEPGSVAFAVHVSIDLGLADDSPVQVAAEVPADADVDTTFASGEAASSSAPATEGQDLSAVEMAMQRIQERDMMAAPSQISLERSKSGKHVSCPGSSVKHLPPVTLRVALPPEYPASAPPYFELSCLWLNGEQLACLCAELESQAAELEGCPVIFAWTSALRDQAATLLGIGSEVRLAPSEVEGDIRGVSELVDPIATLMELVQYDQQKELSLWRQQAHQCPVCFSDKPGTHFVHLGGCSHAFCQECIGDMARIHVAEGSIAELRCPQPDCRAEIGPNALQAVLDGEAYERWHRLKVQQVMASELEGLVFCPRCEEMGRETPVIASAAADADDAPHAKCPRCGYIFCSLCLAVAHATRAECISKEEMAYRAAMRKPVATSAADKRRQEKLLRGRILEIPQGGERPVVDASGHIDVEFGEAKVGDEVLSVSSGSSQGKQGLKLLWSREKDDLGQLEKKALDSQLPLVVRYRAADADAQAERLRKRRVWEELLSLRLIAGDSKVCPKCGVRINRSAGCNHMTCTQCRTHFCYRCGKTLNPDRPYDHFSASACPTFDREEVQRIQTQERAGGARGHDAELEELRRQFGRQEELLAHFQAGRTGRPRRREAGDSACPTCGQWNARQGRLNHVRCHACRNSYCHACGRRIVGMVTQHYRGAGACAQHGD